ncbi:MAG: hypothetical protein ACLSDQ_10780 [Adlercreutzia equolifaciens]
MATLIADKYEAWKAEANARFDQLKANEEELNRIFAEIYNMVGEVPIEVEDKYVSVARIFDTAEEIPESFKGNKYVRTRRDEIVSLISYAVGCMLGRYSLERSHSGEPGDTLDEYLDQVLNPLSPDEDNVLPITDDEYLTTTSWALRGMVRAAYGEETLENLRYVPCSAQQPRQVIRDYFVKEFYRDHCQTYQKRPIYWLFDSGKKNGFKALVYMHRYRPDLLARLRTDYVHEQQERYRTQIAHLEEAEAAASGAERTRIGKQLKKLRDQLDETTAFEEKVHHLADQMIEIDLTTA